MEYRKRASKKLPKTTENQGLLKGRNVINHYVSTFRRNNKEDTDRRKRR